MSLIDGPDIVQVYPEVLGTDSDGNRIRKPSDTPVEVLGRVQPVSTTEAAALGQEWSSYVKLLCREFPAGAWAEVVWDGRSWDVQGEPQPNGLSPSTRHVRVILRARDPLPLA